MKSSNQVTYWIGTFLHSYPSEKYTLHGYNQLYYHIDIIKVDKTNNVFPISVQQPNWKQNMYSDFVHLLIMMGQK